ncbi:hypothetical protein AZI86_14245 [Bdellovibrio bacteriovorus]|uniref:Uncharacterized protein n=1 Tax=Bdellovibrio bacteriovorus TaxID=959 RepID=A0A150WJS9_BDEBC|nr:CopG family antitoxin [Bdellovibrio bacteriovorus]KYG63966.1 hypothetical protein AZI86_14245 [Bdellovibrio bacteriovorus]
MAKNKSPKISPEEAVQFLDDMRKLSHEVDEKTVAISIRIPENVLRAVKTKAKSENRKYQSVMIEYIRKGLKVP